MGHCAAATTRPDRARWVMHGPMGMTATWETQIVEERPGERMR